jgi:hypothetical protein
MFTADASSVERLQKAWGDGCTVQFSPQGQSPGSMLQAASDIVAANPGAKVSVLDHSALQVCQVTATTCRTAGLQKSPGWLYSCCVIYPILCGTENVPHSLCGSAQQRPFAAEALGHGTCMHPPNTQFCVCLLLL